MKKNHINFSLLIVFIFTSIYIIEINSPVIFDIMIPLNRKDLLNLQEGNYLHKVQGVKTKFNNIDCTVRLYGDRFFITSNEILYQNFKNIILIPNLKNKAINIHNHSVHGFSKKIIKFS